MDRKTRILILEDEFITQQALKNILIDSGYEISGTAMKADDAIAILEKGDTDIAILDINVKGDKNGIWVAKQIYEKYKIPYLFLTAFSDESIIKEATEYYPSGYLVKPFDKDDIFASIQVAQRNYNIAKVPSAQKSKEDTKTIFIKSDHIFVKIDLTTIKYIHSNGNYIEVYQEEKKSMIRYTLKNFQEHLPQSFVQIHRSYVVNMYKVDSFSMGFVRLGDKEINISEKYREAFMEAIKVF